MGLKARGLGGWQFEGEQRRTGVRMGATVGSRQKGSEEWGGWVVGVGGAAV